MKTFAISVTVFLVSVSSIAVFDHTLSTGFSGAITLTGQQSLLMTGGGGKFIDRKRS